MCFYIKRANLLVEAHAIIFFLKLQKTMTSYAYFDRLLFIVLSMSRFLSYTGSL